MSRLIERAKELRNDTKVHYNCAQAVVVPFAEVKGIPAEQVFLQAAKFGSGMGAGLTCGAITGGLMALGLLEITDPGVTGEFIRRMAQKHDGMTNCKDLLGANAKTGRSKKDHCDEMVYQAVELLEEMLQERK